MGGFNPFDKVKDFVEDTIDFKIVAALKKKIQLSAQTLGEDAKQWLI